MAFPHTATLIGMVQSFDVDEANIAAGWFPRRQTMNDYYEFDIVDWSRGKAKYRHPDGLAGTQAVRTKTRKKVALPTQREKKMLRESTLRWEDAPGQKAPERIRRAVASELRDLDMIIERTHEWARWQLLTTGAITLVGENTDTYTFGIGTTATAGDAWDTVGASDPIGDLIAWKLAVEQASGRKATELVITTAAIEYLFESSKALTVLGERTKDRYRETGKVDRLVDMDVTIQDRGYRDDSDTFKYYLSDDGAEGNMCLIKTDGPLGVTAEGPPVDSRAPEGMIGKFAKSWVTEDPAGRWILETHTALPGLTQTNNLGAFVLW